MGLLDDAIREHLDLKRRRGADPAAIERAEREALGPVRRNRETGIADGSEPSGGAVNEVPPVGLAYDESDEPIAGELAESEPGLNLAPPPPAAAVDAEPPFSAGRVNEVEAESELFVSADDDAPPTQVMRAAEIPSLSDATAEFDVEAALAAEARGEAGAVEDDEDVLEETPEFLQDTPDHDRLWFEQRPPRNFDFDG